MSDNIISLTGRNTDGPASEPSQYLIETLEDLLERAKSGQIVGMAAVCLEHDGQSPYCLVGRIGGFTMAGSLSTLTHIINVQNAADSHLED